MRKNLIRPAIVIAAIVATLVPTVAAVAPRVDRVAPVAEIAPAANLTNITKSFEIGPGTPNGNSTSRTFDIPSKLEVAAVVKYRRLGSGKEGIPIAIELHEPDVSPGVEGPIVETKQVEASPIEQSVTIRSVGSNRGCSKPWRVRVRYAGTGTAPAFAVFGTARLDWDGTTKTISAETPGLVIRSTILSTKEAKIGGPTGFGEGTLVIRTNWNHMIGPVPGPSPVKFRVFLINRMPQDPGHDIINTSQDAYSSNEANATPKFGITYRVREIFTAQWSLIFQLLDPHDAFIQTPTVQFSPTCA